MVRAPALPIQSYLALGDATASEALTHRCLRRLTRASVARLQSAVLRSWTRLIDKS